MEHNQIEKVHEVWSSKASYLSLASTAYCLFGSLILSTKVLQGLLLDTFSTTSGFVVLLASFAMNALDDVNQH